MTMIGLIGVWIEVSIATQQALLEPDTAIHTTGAILEIWITAVSREVGTSIGGLIDLPLLHSEMIAVTTI